MDEDETELVPRNFFSHVAALLASLSTARLGLTGSLSLSHKQ